MPVSTTPNELLRPGIESTSILSESFPFRAGVAVVSSDLITLGVVLAILAGLLLALQSLTIRYGTVTARSSDALVVVLLVNLAVLVPIAVLFGKAPTGSRGDLYGVAAFAGAGIAGVVFGRALHFEGIRRVGASRADAIKASQPLHASLIAVIVLNEVVTLGHLLAMVAIVAGVALITAEYRTGAKAGTAHLRDLSIPFAAALFFGLEPVFMSLGIQSDLSIWTGLATVTVSGTVAYALYLRIRGDVPRPWTFDRRELAWLVTAGLVNTGFLVAFYLALQLESVSLVVPLLQLSPLFVIGISALVVRDSLERITVRLVVASIIVVIGAIGVTLLRAP